MEKETPLSTKLTQPASLENESKVERGGAVFSLLFLAALAVVAAAVYFI